MAPKRTPKERLAKYLKRYKKMQNTLKAIDVRKAIDRISFKDYLADEKFKETLSRNQQKSLRVLDATDRQNLLKMDLRQMASDYRGDQLEAKDFYQYVERLVAEVEEASHRTTTEFFEDRNKVDDLTLISLDAAYYLALAGSGIDPCCFVELM